MGVICKNCGGANIRQAANLLLDPNRCGTGPFSRSSCPPEELVTREDLETLVWEDFYYCKDCALTAKVKET